MKAPTIVQEECVTLDLDCIWDGIKPPKWIATKPWPDKVFLRYYDVGTPIQRNGKLYQTYYCVNGTATYEIVEDEFGDYDGTLQGGSSYNMWNK